MTLLSLPATWHLHDCLNVQLRDGLNVRLHDDLKVHLHNGVNGCLNKRSKLPDLKPSGWIPSGA